MAKDSGGKWGLISILVIIVSAILIWLGLKDSGGARVKTAREFVEVYSSAWKRGNVDKIMRMQYLGEDLPVGAQASEAADKMAKKLKEDMAKAEIRRDLDSNNIFGQAWKKTKYLDEAQFDGYTCVKVNAAGGISQIVLRKDGESLKIVPNPSDYDCLGDGTD